MAGKVSVTALALVLLAGTVGCPPDPVLVFSLDQVINAPGSDTTREELDVDVLLLTRQDAIDHPDLLNGAIKSKDWFDKRSRDDVTQIESKQILAYRRRHTTQSDRRQGISFMSGMDRQSQADIRLETEHPEPGKGSIVIFGSWRGMDGPATRRPLVIRPLPGWGDDAEIRVRVGREDFECLNCPD